MYNATIAALERIDSSTSFERLCDTLLLRLYPNLVPIGRTADRGRDAIAEYFEATDPAGRKVVMQFSHQTNWRSKLQAELEKARRNNLEPARYVFVTNQSISGPARSDLEVQVPAEFGWEIELYDQEWLRARLESPEYLHLRQEYLGLPPESIPLFLTPEQFAARASRPALPGFDIPLVGRDRELAQLSEWLDSDFSVLTLSGQGGVGKTKLVGAFAEQVAEAGHWRPVFVRVDAEQFESHLAELTPGQPYLVIINEVERFRHKEQLIELLVSPGLGPAKIILVTRPAFKDEVASFASQFRVQELALGRMPRTELDRVITGNPCYLADIPARNAVLDLAQGHPLVAIAACTLLAKGQALKDVTQDEVLGRYFDHVVEDAIRGEPATTRDYLAILVGLDGIPLGDSRLRESVRTALSIDEAEERRIIQHLIRTDLVLERDSHLRVVPTMLATYLLLAWFFDSRGDSRYDFRTFILESFFASKSADIIRNLATAEVLDEASAASRLLSPILDDMLSWIRDGDNLQRLTTLHAIEEVADEKADHAVVMVQSILEGLELPPATYEHPLLGPWDVKHSTVLSQAIRVLDRAKRSAVEESLRDLFTLSRYGGTAEEYRSVRNEAVQSLESFFEIDPRNTMAVYDRALTEVTGWLEREPGDAMLVVRLLSNLLGPLISWVERSPEHTHAIVWSKTPLLPTPQLAMLRERTLGLLHDLYLESDSPAVRKSIIDAHSALAPDTRRPLPEALQQQIDRDVETSAAFFRTRLDDGADLYECSAIRSWAIQMDRFAGYLGEVLKDLVRRIERLPEFQRYMHLVDYPSRRLRRAGFKAAHKQLLEFRGRMVAKVDAESIDTFVDELERIVSNHRASGGTSTTEVERLVGAVAHWKPGLAEHALRRAADEQLDLRYDISEALLELKKGRPASTQELMTDWARRQDPILHRAILMAFQSGQAPSEADLQIVEDIAQSNDPANVRHVIRTLPRFQAVEPQRAIDLLKTIAAAADEDQLGAVAEVLADDGFDRHGRRHFLDVDLADLDALTQNFLRMRTLNSNGGLDVALTVRQLGLRDPLRMLAFLRARIEQEEEPADVFSSTYDAIPYHFEEAFKGLDERPDYLDLLREVRGWVAEAGGKVTTFTAESARILKQLSDNKLDGPLRVVLEEWLGGSDEERHTVAFILREFSEDPVFYEIAKKLIADRDDEIVRRRLSRAILSVSTGGFGSWAPAIALRRKAFTGWLADTTTPARVKVFARQMIEGLDELSALEARNLAARAGGI